MHRTLTLAAFIILVLGGGTLIGISNIPGPWYAGLSKPPFNPPNWIFGPVWSVLYVMIAISGWRLWQGHRKLSVMKMWWAALGLNFLWSPVFFGLQNPSLALGTIVVLLIVLINLVRRCWNLDRTSAWLLVPYVAWVAFASLLNASICWLNL